MKRFTIFGSRLLFWLLAPWVIAGALFFPYLAYQAFVAKETTGAIIAVVLSLCCIFFLLMAISPSRFAWLSVFIGGSITMAYVWYFCDTYLVHHEAIIPTLDFSEPTPFNAILGFLVWGLPSLLFTISRIRVLVNKREQGKVKGATPVNGTWTDLR
jgi:hypothetical protein